MHDVEQSGGDDATLYEPASQGLSGHAAENLPRRYLALVAGIAGRLLAAENDDGMVGELFALIREELRLDVFFNYRLEGDGLVLEGHGGLTEREAEICANLALGEAVCGRVARDRVPEHAINVQASADPRHGFIRSIRINAYACTPLMHGNQMLGTLSFGRRQGDRFSEDELSFLQTICHYAALAKHRLRVEQELREGVEYRERLLGELNHRVRNALQLAIGLVTLEAGTAEPAARDSLQRAADRLQVLAAAHRPLYATKRPDRIDLLILLRGVIEQAVARPVIIVADAEIEMPVERAVALALLTHELLDTSIPCGGQPNDADVPQIALRNDRGGNDLLRLEFSGVTNQSQGNDVGRKRMIDALARQLRATIIAGEPHGGLIVSIPDFSRG